MQLVLARHERINRSVIIIVGVVWDYLDNILAVVLVVALIVWLEKDATRSHGNSSVRKTQDKL